MDGQGNQTSGPSGLLQAIRFINPDEGGTQNAATIVHSHAARTAHARRRRARVVAYQASRGVGQPQGDPLQIPNGAIDGVTAMSPYGSHHASPEVIGSGRSDPFASFARPFSPLETFLLDHYIAHIVPRMKSQCRGLRARGQVYADAMTADWVRLALTNPECLNSLFLNAARHASVSHQQEQQQERFAELAVRYKLLSVRAVSRAIASSDGEARGFDDAVFAEILALAFDEVGNPVFATDCDDKSSVG
ncbi:hypothetical protein B0H67DRAFT_590941 [Lasiosphaeris hirsuta]|uniref:Uncharacterized protein n=1 Tax=Lasiosphaeris hirsuta TaxID=260670 RepID=A0AA40DM15_9PEZI|nr:hypothetical protein B0H67DRAFT_590941 [Lasiosphaeris hirsuta]